MAQHGEPERIYPLGYEPSETIPELHPGIHNELLNHILESAPEASVDTDLFAIMAKRRSTRKFTNRPVETIKVDKIISAADTAPTAGNFQGFEIYYVKSPEKKERLVGACNNQAYVNAPLVLVFCKNPARVKLDFSEYTLKKFAIQDATLAAAYSQLAAHALGLSSIWIGKFDEQEVADIIGTKLIPSCVMCIGYAPKMKHPKPRRNLKDLVHVVW